MNLSLRKALEECRDLWAFLAEDTERGKSDLPGFERKRYENDCPICHYVFQEYKKKTGYEPTLDGFVERYGSHCENCTLIDLWPDGCMDDASPYHAWLVRTFTTRRKGKAAARKIVKYVTKKLEDMGVTTNA